MNRNQQTHMGPSDACYYADHRGCPFPTMCECSCHKSLAGDSTPPATREGVWNPNGEGEQPDIPGGNAKDHARAKQPVVAYACLYPKLAAVAREHGYALAMHGSLVADCDLIAVPWVENAASGDDLARALAVAAPGHLILDTYAARPGGVRKHVIHLGGGPYIDLAVCALGAGAPQGGEQ